MDKELLLGKGWDKVGNPEDWGYTQSAVDNMVRDGKLFKEGNFSKEDFYNSEDYEESNWIFCEFLNNVGTLYSDGVGIPVDNKEAAYFYQAAIDKGESYVAGCNLGDIYRKGLGGEKNAAKAFEAYLTAIHPYAYYRVGEAYENGWGVEKNIDKAKHYYRMSYSEGHRLAKKKLETFNFLED